MITITAAREIRKERQVCEKFNVITFAGNGPQSTPGCGPGCRRPSCQPILCSVEESTNHDRFLALRFFRGLRNPVGIKVGPSSEPVELVRLLGIVDPDREPGRVTLITRYGADLVDKKLPAHIEAVTASGHPVVWCCDPMHGNTRSAAGGIKTRAMHDIVSEISSALRIHQSMGTNLGGIHLELTGDIQQDGQSVTECTGGSMELGEEELALRFESYCDPRLNFEQSLDVAFMLSQAGNSSRGTVDHQILQGLTESRPSSVAAQR